MNKFASSVKEQIEKKSVVEVLEFLHGHAEAKDWDHSDYKMALGFAIERAKKVGDVKLSDGDNVKGDDIVAAVNALTRKVADLGNEIRQMKGAADTKKKK